VIRAAYVCSTKCVIFDLKICLAEPGPAGGAYSVGQYPQSRQSQLFFILFSSQKCYRSIGQVYFPALCTCHRNVVCLSVCDVDVLLSYRLGSFGSCYDYTDNLPSRLSSSEPQHLVQGEHPQILDGIGVSDLSSPSSRFTYLYTDSTTPQHIGLTLIYAATRFKLLFIVEIVTFSWKSNAIRMTLSGEALTGYISGN